METIVVGPNSVQVDIDTLRPPAWVLRPVDQSIVSELARSIQNAGLLQPIVVRKSGQGYEVVFGNHRLEACKKLGMKTIHAMVCDFNEDESFLARIAENLVRNTAVNAFEEAHGYKMLIRRGWTIHTIGQKIGKSDSYVCRRLAIIDRLDRDLVRKASSKQYGWVTPSHMELLSLVPDVSRQKELINHIEQKRLSVRALENLLNGIPPPMDVLVENVAGECTVKIPKDFARAAGVNTGHHLRLCIQGRKLILESKRDRRTVNSNVHVAIPNQTCARVSR
jgi:ParB family chromosome partitioning protein